ncbi:MAG: Lhr family helicase, partial [Acidimicrobiia bacterium]
MEEVGKVRRGYFVEGLGGAQFALAGAVDRLRSPGRDEVIGLAATDPANPFGTILPWPETEIRLQRTAGAYVILGNGELAAYLDRSGRRLYLFSSPEGEIAREIAAIGIRRRRLLIEQIDDVPAAQSAFGASLTEWGFVPALRGLAFRGQ